MYTEEWVLTKIILNNVYLSYDQKKLFDEKTRGWKSIEIVFFKV